MLPEYITCRPRKHKPIREIDLDDYDLTSGIHPYFVKNYNWKRLPEVYGLDWDAPMWKEAYGDDYEKMKREYLEIRSRKSHNS